jgi:hypothetical protein
MLALTIDSPQIDSGCIKCCCELVMLKPGETQPLVLNYAPWAIPIAQRGLYCEPVVEIEEKNNCSPGTTGDQPPAATSELITYDVALNTAAAIDLATAIEDPEAQPLTFKVLTGYGPFNGYLKPVTPGVNDGAYTYTPHTGYRGPDRFFVSASDGVNKPEVFEVLLGVGGVLGSTVTPTPVFSVGKPSVNQKYYTVVLPLAASPAAKTCQSFRLSIRQGAQDCDWNCYYHVDCVDVRIANC